MMPDEHNRIEKLTKNLYSRKAPDLPVDDRAPISREEYIVNEAWQEPAAVLTQPKQKTKLFKKVLIAALIFFFLSSGIAIFMFLGGFNIISSQNVDIAIAGPVSIAGGEVLPLGVTVQNKNNTDLQVANLTIEYPNGTRSAEDLLLDYPRYKEALGTISSGKSVTRTVRAVLFGEENSSQEIKISVEYQIKGSNSTFHKEKTYPVALGASPVSVKVDNLKEVNSNQDTQFTVTLTSNSNTVQKNILLTAVYPTGFSYLGASSSPTSGNNIWNIGELAPGEKRVVVVKGRIEGQDGEERVFHWNIGIQNPDDPKTLQTTFISVLSPISIKRPFIGVELLVNGVTGKQFVAERGVPIVASISWKNNLPSKITDAEISLRIGGKLLNRQSITPANGGFYRSLDNTIVWNEAQTRSLTEMNPGDMGQVDFTFSTFDLSRAEYNALVNQDISMSIDVKGKRLGDKDVPEEITSSVTRVIKLNSNIALNPKINYAVGPFQNTGGLPPHVEKPTTYTVTWTVTNAANNIGDARVTATLPPYVSWMNKILPTTEKLTFNPEKNAIIWQIGALPAKTGYQAAPRTVAFQVQFLPSLSQLGTRPDLVTDMLFTARDTFTDQILRATYEDLTTEFNENNNGTFSAEVAR